MGMICPECGQRKAVVGHITINGLPPKSAGDVIASRLACGHVVGGEDYEALVEQVRKIDVKKVDKIALANKEARNAKTAAYKAHVEEVRDNGTE